MILPSGETLKLKSELGNEGLEITVSKPPSKLIVHGNNNRKVSILYGKC